MYVILPKIKKYEGMYLKEKLIHISLPFICISLAFSSCKFLGYRVALKPLVHGFLDFMLPK